MMTGAIQHLSLDEVERSDEWARLCGSDDLFASPQWFPIERSKSGPWVPVANGCLAAADSGRLVAGVTLQQYDLTVEDGIVRVDKMLATQPAYKEIPADRLAGTLLPALMCGGWFNSRILEADGISKATARAACRELIAECIKVGRQWGSSSIFLPYLDAENTELRQDLRAVGFVEVPAPVRYVFNCNYPSYDFYYHNVLRERHRHRIQKELCQFYEAGPVTQRTRLSPWNVSRIAELAHELELKYGHTSKLDQLVGWFTDIASYNRTTVFTATLKNRLFGMNLWIHRHDRIYAFHCGFDYEITRHVPHAYSVIGYRLPIAWACSDPGIRYMEYGIGTDEAKRIRGCFGVPQVLSVKALSDDAVGLIDLLQNRREPVAAGQQP